MPPVLSCRLRVVTLFGRSWSPAVAQPSQCPLSLNPLLPFHPFSSFNGPSLPFAVLVAAWSPYTSGQTAGSGNWQRETG